MIEEGAQPSSSEDRKTDLETGVETGIVQSATTAANATDDDLVLDDLLVEEVSIDGMCGVY